MSLLSKHTNRDYGRLARFGVATPQANPTVEPELQRLLPPGSSLLATRLTSGGEPRQRFLNYWLQLPQSIASFDTLTLDAFGYACTASNYLIEREQQCDALAEIQQRCPYPICTAADAIEAALKHLRAQRIALACPYPAWLLDAAVTYWRGCGFDIVQADSLQPDTRDTRSIYRLTSEEAGQFLESIWRDTEADAYVITGTGMPSLRVIADLQPQLPGPVLSSNLCLAWQLLQVSETALGRHAPDNTYPLLAGWPATLEAD